MSALAKQLSGQSQAKVFAKGGKVHDDVVADKKLIKQMVKPATVKPGMKKGGKACG